MDMLENIAATIRTVMKKKHMSLSEFADELGISRSSLHNYITARGNPSVATIEHLAQGLGVSSAALTAGMMDQDQREIALLLLELIQSIAELSEADRMRMAELFLEMVKLWNHK